MGSAARSASCRHHFCPSSLSCLLRQCLQFISSRDHSQQPLAQYWLGRMFFKHIDLTTALRPSYLPDEVLLFVQDNVGLYEGKFKIPDHQNGQVYLTSHRICYVDNGDPRKNSTAIDLKDVERYEFYGGFLKSSPKITLVPKPIKRSSIQNRAISSLNGPSRSATASPSRIDSPFHLPTPEPSPASTATWICTICSFSNPVPTGLDQAPVRSESPGPILQTLPLPTAENGENIKLSFRAGGGPIFYERLKGSMQQRKWLLQGAPPIPTAAEQTTSGSGTSTPTGERVVKTVGIAGLEQRRLDMRKNNELVIGNAFEDLEALMASAKEIVALAESFSSNGGGAETNAVANALGLVTTKEMLGGGSNSESLYISELSRNLAEFLTDDARGVLRKAGGIISLVDLWAVFNRARGGVEPVSPLDFEKAARLWEKLRLPVRLRQFKSGVLVVQSSDRTDEKTIRTLLAWLNDLHVFPPDKDLPWDWQVFGRGVTAQDAAERFGWSIGVAEEELEMAEEKT